LRTRRDNFLPTAADGNIFLALNLFLPSSPPKNQNILLTNLHVLYLKYMFGAKIKKIRLSRAAAATRPS
jgi:hypothetical protein